MSIFLIKILYPKPQDHTFIFFIFPSHFFCSWSSSTLSIKSLKVLIGLFSKITKGGITDFFHFYQTKQPRHLEKLHHCSGHPNTFQWCLSSFLAFTRVCNILLEPGTVISGSGDASLSPRLVQGHDPPGRQVYVYTQTACNVRWWWTFSSHIVEEDVGLPQANHGHPYVWPGVELDHLTQGGRVSEGEHGGAGVGV